MYRWIPDGDSYMTMPTLGNLLGKKIRIVIEGFSFNNAAMTNCYVFSQAGNSAGTREFGLFFNNADGDVEIFYGGQSNVMLTDDRQTFFGNASGSVESVLFDFEIDTATGDWRQLIDGEQRSSGSVTLTGTGRIDGMLARIGARGTSDVPTNTGGSFFMAANSFRIGNTKIYIDDVLARDLVMPGGVATAVPDLVASNDAVVRNSAGVASDWDSLLEVNFAALATSVDGVELGQNDVLSVAAAAIETAVDGVDIQQASTLSVGALLVGLMFEQIALSQSQVLGADDMFLPVEMASVVLSQAGLLAVADLSLLPASDSIVLALNSVISVADVVLPVALDSLVLDQSSLLVVADVGLSISAETPVLLQLSAISVSDARLSVLMDSLTIGGGVFVTESAFGMIIRDFEYVLLEGC